MKMGQYQKTQIERHREIFAALDKVAPTSFGADFSSMRSKLDDWAARIAVVGQVKAGKSSLLNALLNKTSFLPSDVNPWTSVVTNIRFNLPGDPHGGATFEFFDQDSWDRIINGDPEMRELAENLLPGFNADVLHRQTAEMRERAQRRLGRFYSTLLGSKHEYDVLSPNLLERYVCAGPGADDGLEREALGRYASITKEARIYLRSDEYAVPTIVTDTPGVNDPFLVRDEFTCQSLRKSDIFVVTLSAHQPLTDVDVALIKMLGNEATKDVVVFINRIDELENFGTQINRLLKDVTARISEAIPERSFTVLCGSAFWAHLAIADSVDQATLQELADSDGLIDYVKSQVGQVPADPVERLMIASGVPALKNAISEAINFGSGSRFLAQIGAESRSRIAALKASTRMRITRLDHQTKTASEGSVDEFRSSLFAELKDLDTVYSSLVEIVAKAEEDIATTVNSSWEGTRRQIDFHVHDFISQQKEVILELWDGGQHSDQSDLEVDILPLRDAIEGEVREGYRAVKRNLDQICSDALSGLIDCVGRVVDRSSIEVTMDGLPAEDILASMSTGRKVLNISLVPKRNWTFWRKQNPEFDKILESLKKITAAEVLPAANQLLESYLSTMERRGNAGRDRLQMVISIVEHSLKDRRERLALEEDMLSRVDDSSTIPAPIQARIQSDLVELHSCLRAIEKYEASLTTDEVASAA